MISCVEILASEFRKIAHHAFHVKVDIDSKFILSCNLYLFYIYIYIYIYIQGEPELLLQKNMVDIGC